MALDRLGFFAWAPLLLLLLLLAAETYDLGFKDSNAVSSVVC